MAGHQPVPIDVDAQGVWRQEGEMMTLSPGRGIAGVDVVFPMLHGPFGEDGTVQGLLECLDVPYVGAGVLAGALCMDKVRFKELMTQLGVPQSRYEPVQIKEFSSTPGSVLERLVPLGVPAYVKPANNGSSFGVTRVVTPEGLPCALEVAFQFGPVAIVEAAAVGCEVECSVIGNDRPLVSEPGELRVVKSRSGWRDQATKATRRSINVIVPAEVSDCARQRIRELSLTAFQRTRCRGLARVDFFVDGETVLINEVNTMPGLLPTSVFSLCLEASGLTYPAMLDRLLQLACERV